MGLNPKPSALDQDQIIRRVFDGDNDKLRVDASVSLSPGSVVLDSVTSSVSIGNETGGLVTTTNIDTKTALDVNVANDLNLIIDAASDTIAIEDASGNALNINTDGSIDVAFSLKVGGRILEVNLDDTWKPLPAIALDNRKALVIQNDSGKEIKINYINTVGYVGIKIKNGIERCYALENNVIMYGRCDAGQSGTVVIEEIA